MRYTINIDDNLILTEDSWKHGIPFVVNIRNEIDEKMVQGVVKDLDAAYDTKQEIIPILVHSPGGLVTSALEIVDKIESMKENRKILTFGTGCVASAASILLSCGTEGYRYCSENTEVMVHQVSSILGGKAEDIRITAEQIEHTNKSMFRLLDKNTGQKKGYWKKLLKKQEFADVYLTSRQAKDHNLVNHVGIPHLELTVASVLRLMK